MDCNEARRNLMAYVDGELPAETAGDFAAHLSACVPCTAELAAQRRLRAILRAAAPAAGRRPPSANAARITLDARRASAQEAILLRALRRVSAAAAVFLMVSGLTIGLSRSGGSGVAAAQTSLRQVAVSSVKARREAVIDRENSIVLAFTRR